MKKLVIAIVVLCMLFVAGFAGYRGHRIWKQKRLVTQAHEFIAKGDTANALLCLRLALEKNPDNAEACRLMADFAETARSPQAIYWRNRLVELEPHSLTNRLALARVALALGDVLAADKALDGVEEEGKRTAAYHRAAGAADVAAKRVAGAEAHFLEAARLDPTDLGSQLGLATLRLHLPSQQAVAEGRMMLVGLSANPAVRCDALRQLAFDALRYTNLDAAFDFSQQLLKETNSTFNDRLLHLDLLASATNSALPVFLATLQRDCTHNPAEAHELGRWLLRAGRPEEALAWLNTLPPSTRTNLPVPLLEADLYMAVNDWSGLSTNLAAQTWFDLDCLRLACRARAFRELGMGTSAKAQWIDAMKASEHRLDRLIPLLNMASAWRWAAEQEDLLWVVVNQYPKEQWAVRALAERLFTEGRTRALLGLYETALRNEKQSLVFMNDLAMTALLLESWDKKPHELAHEIYSKDPTNAMYVSTYAYSLLLQQKTVEALRTMEQLKPEQLQIPAIATYYGLILNGAGQADRAKQYLELAAKARLLPEEQKLVEKAKRGS